jgi:vacuolar protein sorting-associated protein 35
MSSAADPKKLPQGQDEEDFEEEQNLVARLVHHLCSNESEEQYRILLASRRHFGQGGPKRLRHTLPPLVFAGLHLVRQLAGTGSEEEESTWFLRLPSKRASLTRVTRTRHSCRDEKTVPVSPSDHAGARRHPLCRDCVPPVPAVRTGCQRLQAGAGGVRIHGARIRDFRGEHSGCACVGSSHGICVHHYHAPRAHSPLQITDSKAQVTALQLIVGALHRCTVFGTENRAALVHKATGYSAKLLKKPDQCRAVYMCAHLFWHDTTQELCDAASVLQCLKRALKIANAAQVRASSEALDFVSISQHCMVPPHSKCRATPVILVQQACSSRS